MSSLIEMKAISVPAYYLNPDVKSEILVVVTSSTMFKYTVVPFVTTI